MRLRCRSGIAAVAVLLLVALPGCSSDDDPDANADAGPDLPSRAQLSTYFEAVASYDPDQLADAASVAKDGSPAAGYVAYLAGYAASAIAADQAAAASEVTEVDGGFEACGGTGEPDECVTWADLVGTGGELTDFTVDDVPLEESLVDLGGQPPVESAGLYSVRPDHAYLSPQSGTLFVVVTITAGDVAVEPRPGVYIEQDRILKGVETSAPATVVPGASTPVLLAFPDAEEAALDGQVTFDLGLSGLGTESVGFGLAT